MRYVAFLRALNVGGRIVKMGELAAVFDAAGLTGVETFLASGNVLFDADPEQIEVIHDLIENRFQSTFGFVSQTFIRSSFELAAIAARNPFPVQLSADAPTNCVGFTRVPLPADAVPKLKSIASEADHFYIESAEIYWLSSNPQSESSFTLKQLEKALGMSATFRGMTTIVRLANRCK